VTARKREPRAITMAEIEQRHELASYWFGDSWRPAVFPAGMGYEIRILKSLTIVGNDRQVTYDYFVLDLDGTVTTAPRGWAKAYKPGRVVDIEAAAAKYEAPQADARRIA
jgi:hypothetical protein